MHEKKRQLLVSKLIDLPAITKLIETRIVLLILRSSLQHYGRHSKLQASTQLTTKMAKTNTSKAEKKDAKTIGSLDNGQPQHVRAILFCISFIFHI